MESYEPEANRTEKVLSIVPCGKRKIWSKNSEAGAISARNAYISPYFKLCREFAERFSDKWVILSAKYGFIDPDFIIPENYDTSFKYSQDQTISIEKLKQQAKELEFKEFGLVIVLGGERYLQIIQSVLEDTEGLKVEAPLRGLAIGQRQRILRRWLT